MPMLELAHSLDKLRVVLEALVGLGFLMGDSEGSQALEAQDQQLTLEQAHLLVA